MKPLARWVPAALLLALAALAGAGSKPPKKDTSVQPREAQLIAALPDEDRRWLTEFVAPIILPDEKNAYLELMPQIPLWQPSQDAVMAPSIEGYTYQFHRQVDYRDLRRK